MLPLAVPAALLTARSLPRSWIWALVVLGGATAIVQVRMHASAAATYPTFVHGVRAATAPAEPVALVLAQSERAAVAVLRPGWQMIDLRDVVAQPAELIDATVASVGVWLPGLTAEGQRLVISDESLAQLRGINAHGARLADAILARCDARAVTVAGFRGQLLELRGG